MAKRGAKVRIRKSVARHPKKAEKRKRRKPLPPSMKFLRRFRRAARAESTERPVKLFGTPEKEEKAKVLPKPGAKPEEKAKPEKKLSLAPPPARLSFSTTLDKYEFTANNIAVNVTIGRVKDDYVPIYHLNMPLISPTTVLVLERIRHELISTVQLSMIDLTDPKRGPESEQRLAETIAQLIRKYFPDAGEKTIDVLVAYLMQKTLGMGDIETLMHDKQLEEIAINSSDEPVWVYHRKWGWLKTTIKLKDEEQVRNYAAMIGRKVGRQINVLEPLMDANMRTGDRVNATLMPISLHGNTITLRKFASKPWTITDLIANKTIDVETAALIWEAIQYELSILVAGGTATGKTSFLNSLSNFFPPNQRIVSIEDTRELQLAKFLHWVPMITRLPGPEGRGAITMLDLLVNSLRMRPDRIIVGEIRRKAEAEVLFEAIHTGHSVYATVHANNVRETFTRLTSPPIEVPQGMLPALNMIVVQYRNRRTGIRRTFQVAEMLESGEPSVLMQYDTRRNSMRRTGKSKSLHRTLLTYAGITPAELRRHLNEKERILKWLVKKNINTVDEVGKIMAQYYTDSKALLKQLRA